MFSAAATRPAADWAAVDAFAAANGLMADVPEPASAVMMVMAGLGILHRRRRFLCPSDPKTAPVAGTTSTLSIT
ncbi:MAG: PEP-CTERM sorting domain-containing protein [Tepidisphaeraceae bacterium]